MFLPLTKLIIAMISLLDKNDDKKKRIQLSVSLNFARWSFQGIASLPICSDLGKKKKNTVLAWTFWHDDLL